MGAELISTWAAPLGAAVAFVAGLYQWVDTRRRDLNQRRFEQFHRAFEWLAGQSSSGVRYTDVQQALGAYELMSFPEYRQYSLPIIDYYLQMTDSDLDTSLFRRALITSKRTLSAGRQASPKRGPSNG